MTLELESIIENIIQSAQENIKQLTNFDVILRPEYVSNKKEMPDAVEMLAAIALSQQMTMDDYFEHSRLGEYVFLRTIAILLITEYYPHMRGRALGSLIGQCRKNVLHNRCQGKKMLLSGNHLFTQQYNKALEAVKIWLNT